MRVLSALLLLLPLGAGEAWRWEPGTDPARLWAATTAADPGQAAMAWLVLAIDGEPLEGGVWWPALAEAGRLARSRPAPATLAEAAPGLWVEAVRGRSAAVLAAVARFPAEADGPDARLLRTWCTCDWRELAAAPPPPGGFAGLVWLRALLRSGRNDDARAWDWPPSGWSAGALAQLCNGGNRHAARAALLDAAVAAEAAAGDDRARAHARRRLRLTWAWLQPERQRPGTAEARALRQRAADGAASDGDPWLLAALGRRQATAEDFAGAGDEVPDLLLARAFGQAPDDVQRIAIVHLLERWRRLRDGGWCGWWPMAAAARDARAVLRLREFAALLADDPLLPALAGRQLPWDARLDPAGIPGFAPTATWRDATVDRDVGNGAWPGLGLTERFAIRWTGQVRAPLAGLYTFATASDDGSILLIDDEAVVDNRGLHGAEVKSGCIRLDAGMHRLDLRFHDYHWGASCRLSWRPPGATALTIIPAEALCGADGQPGLEAAGGPFQAFAIDGVPPVDDAMRQRWAEQAPWADEPALALFQGGGTPAERIGQLLRLLERDPANGAGSWLPQVSAFLGVSVDIRPYAERALAAARSGQPEWAVAWLARNAARDGKRVEAEQHAQRLAESEFLDYAAVPAWVAERLGDWRVAAVRHLALAERFAIATRRCDAALCLLQAGATAEAIPLLEDQTAVQVWERRSEAVPLLRAAGRPDLASRLATAKPDRDSTVAALLLESGRLDEARKPVAYLAGSRHRDGQPIDDQAMVWLGAAILARIHGGEPPDAGYGADLAAAPGLSPALRQVFAALAGGPPPADPWWRALLALAAGDVAAARAACAAADDVRTRTLLAWLDAHPDAAILRRHGTAPGPGADLGR